MNILQNAWAYVSRKKFKTFIIFFILPQILCSFPELATGRSCHENSEFLRQLAVKRSSFCYNGATIENSRSQ